MFTSQMPVGRLQVSRAKTRRMLRHVSEYVGKRLCFWINSPEKQLYRCVCVCVCLQRRAEPKETSCSNTATRSTWNRVWAAYVLTEWSSAIKWTRKPSVRHWSATNLNSFPCPTSVVNSVQVGHRVIRHRSDYSPIDINAVFYVLSSHPNENDSSYSAKTVFKKSLRPL